MQRQTRRLSSVEGEGVISGGGGGLGEETRRLGGGFCAKCSSECRRGTEEAGARCRRRLAEKTFWLRLCTEEPTGTSGLDNKKFLSFSIPTFDTFFI